MKLVILGASGLIGKKMVAMLRAGGHDVVAASRNSGVDVLTGEGLGEALAGADVVVDVTNSPSFADDPVMDFFTTSTTNQVVAAKEAAVGHVVVLSIVGADGLPESGYLRAKVAQEKLIRDSGLPYSIVRATQFEEFAGAIVESMTDGETVRVPDALIQPIAADDVAAEMVRVALGPPLDGVENVGGPAKVSFADLTRRVRGDGVAVAVDPEATYFGTRLAQSSLVVDDQGS